MTQDHKTETLLASIVNDRLSRRQALALGAGWGCRHQSTLSGRIAAQP